MEESSELTAEWTVHAKLKIKPSENNKINLNLEHDAQEPNDEPIKITYDYFIYDNPNGLNENRKLTKTFLLPSNTTNKENILTNLSGGLTSDQSTSIDENLEKNNSQNSRCRSTCSIVLSTDYLSPEQLLKYSKFSTSTNEINLKNISPTHLNLQIPDNYSSIGTSSVKSTPTVTYKDASCQTHMVRDKSLNRSSSRRKGKYDHRRATDSIVSPTTPSPLINEGNIATPSNFWFPSSSIPSIKKDGSPSIKTINSSNKTSEQINNTNQPKQPRTVHIDVYCTGSEEEDEEVDDDDDENYETSSSSHNINILENESNSTPQTVFETSTMRLERIKAGKNDLPRRLQSTDMKNASKLKKFELKESKKYLFDKYIGDHMNNHDENFQCQRNISDDALSSNYARSSFSTVRDFTGSSICSAFGNNLNIQQHDEEDDGESPIKEREIFFDKLFAPDDSFINSDSFEYENSEDRYRIKKMIPHWNRSNSYHNHHFYEDDLKRINNISTLHRSKNKTNLYQLIEETFKKSHEELSSGSVTTQNTSGYSNDYLKRANIFGAVISTLRKPGHHVGPVRNPDCLCEYCRRWLADRDQIRTRALSMDDATFIKNKFLTNRKKKQNN